MESVGLILSQKKKEGQDLSKSPGKYEKENMIYTIKKVIAFVWLLIYLESVMKLWGRFDGFVKISVNRSQILASTLYDMSVKRSFDTHLIPGLLRSYAAPAILQIFGIRWFTA